MVCCEASVGGPGARGAETNHAPRGPFRSRPAELRLTRLAAAAALRTLGALAALGSLRPLVALEPMRPVVPVEARVVQFGTMMLAVLELGVVTVVPEIAVMAHQLAELEPVRLGDLAPAQAARALGEDAGEHHLLARAVGNRSAVQRRLDLL